MHMNGFKSGAQKTTLMNRGGNQEQIKNTLQAGE